MKERNRTILIIGELPPPYTGFNVLTQQLLNSSLVERYRVIFFDLTDRRPNEARGRFDFRNVLMAVYHIGLFIYKIVTYKPGIVYLPIAQGTWGFLRDSFFINIAWVLRRKIVVHLHGSGFNTFYQESPRLLKRLIRHTLKQVAILIVLAESLKPIFRGLVDTKRIRVVYNGIDTREFDTTDVDIERHDSSVRILYLSKKSKAKGILEFLQSIPLIISKNVNVQFIVAGDPITTEEFPLHSGQISQTAREIEGFVKENHISKYVEFHDIVAGVKKINLFKGADIFALPSYSEGMPVVILEAMAAGLPIVATRVGAIPEIIEEGVNGLLIVPGDYDALATKLLFLTKDDAMRQRMGQANYRKVRERFTAESFANQIDKIFMELLK